QTTVLHKSHPRRGFEDSPGLTRTGAGGSATTAVPIQEECMRLTSFEMPKFELPSGELPEAYREWAKGGVTQLKDGYEKIKSAQSNAAELLVGSCKVGAEGALSYGAKVMDSARANSDAAVNLFGNLACATSYAE